MIRKTTAKEGFCRLVRWEKQGLGVVECPQHLRLPDLDLKSVLCRSAAWVLSESCRRQRLEAAFVQFLYLFPRAEEFLEQEAE